MPKKKKELLIGKESRPTAIDYDAPISDWKMRDLMAVLDSRIAEHLKYTPIPEDVKPERWKPEQLKPEKEILKPEKELWKPEKPFDIPDLVERVATRVVEMLEKRGFSK